MRLSDQRFIKVPGRPMSDQSATNRRKICSALTLIVVLNAAGYTWLHACESADRGIDFVQFRLAALYIDSDNTGSLYDDATRKQILDAAWDSARATPGSRLYQAVNWRHARSLELYSSPLLYSAFTIFPDCDYHNALCAYHAICITGTIVGCFGFGYWLQIPRTSLLFAAVTLLAWSPLHSDLRVANVNQILLGMLGITLLLLATMPLRFRDFTVSAWFTWCVAFKPILVWCVVLVTLNACLNGRGSQLKRLATGGILGAVTAILMTIPWFTVTDWLDWGRAVWDMPAEIIRTEMGNISVAHYLTTQALIPGWLPRLAGSALAILTVLTLRRNVTAADSDTDQISDAAHLLAAGCLISLLTARLVWYHYLVLAVPAILIGISGIRNVLRRSRLLAVAFASLLLWSLFLAGIAPVTQWFAADASQRMINATFAVTFLLSLVLCAFQTESPSRRTDNKDPPPAVSKEESRA